MSGSVSTQNIRRSKHEQRSALAVGMVTLLALLLGTVLRSSVQNRSQVIERKGITARVPTQWVVQDGVAELAFVSWDPFAPDVRYAVFLLTDSGDRTLIDISSERSLALGKTLESFRVLEETPILRRGREGYKVIFAFVSSSQPGLPIVVQGMDYYFPADGNTLVISLQADEQAFDEALVQFEPFLDSVTYKPRDSP